MAYKVEKILTDHPLMDEIIYNCKIIMNKIVIKNDEKANDLEEESFIDDVEVFIMINNGTISFETFPFTAEILKAYGYNNSVVRSILTNKSLNTPEKDKDDLLSFACDYFINHYEEKNNYYRMLTGLPDYNTNEYDIYIDKSYLPTNFNKDIDCSKPLHKMDIDIIRMLQSTGKIDELLERYKGSKYTYIRFLGDYKIDLYTARKAAKYDILYMPEVEDLVYNRFTEIYNTTRDIYLKRTYTEAYAYGSEHYEEMMILMILAQTFNDIIVEIPEWYIRRDIFDIRSVQYFLDSFGVAYYKKIPLKYQIRIVKNLNKLIKYKSSNKNFEDILEIFSLKNTSIYKYYLYKKRLLDGHGNYLAGESEDERYSLEFVKAKINESYDDYIKDQIYRTPYDVITYEDKYWDGEDTHDYIRNKHIERDFTLEGTKYMSIEYLISMSEYLFQMEFFIGLLLDSNLDTDDIKISIPSVEPGISFKLSDLFILLFLMTMGYENCSTKIIRPDDNENFIYKKYYDVFGGFSDTKEKYYTKDYNGDNAIHSGSDIYLDTDGKYADDSNEVADYKVSLKVDKPEFTKYHDLDGGYSYTHEEDYDELYSATGTDSNKAYFSADGGSSVEYSEIRSVEYFYDWMKNYIPEFFVDLKERVYGFNTDVDMNMIKIILNRRHSQFQFDNGFTLEDLGIEKFIVPTKISSIEDLTNVYFTNKECYDNLKNKIVYEADDRDEYMTYVSIFNMLFTKKFDYGFYQVKEKDATYLEEILQDRDYILYNHYLKLMSEINLEVRQDNIRDIMNDIINTLEYYLSYEGLEYVFGFATVTSFHSLINYIYLMINFFKSYKVYFLDPFVTYVLDDRLENSCQGKDTIAEMKINYDKWDKQFQNDVVNIKPVHEWEEDGESANLELLDIYGHFDPDLDDDYDYNGMYADSEKTLDKYKDADGGYASDTTCIPFKMLNGGPAHDGSKINIFDLDGAGAMEMKEYLDVDGGYSLDTEDYRKDYWSSGFQYILDGGSASHNQFISRSIRTRVIDRQIESEVRVSDYTGNKLVNMEDGLYVEQQWASWVDFEEFKVSVSDIFNNYSSSYDNLFEQILIAADEDYLNEKISTHLNDLLFGMRKFVSYMESDTFEQSLNNYIDDQVQTLYDEFYGYNPFDWEEF